MANDDDEWFNPPDDNPLAPDFQRWTFRAPRDCIYDCLHAHGLIQTGDYIARRNKDCAWLHAECLMAQVAREHGTFVLHDVQQGGKTSKYR